MDIPPSIREQVLKNVIDTAPFPMGVYVGYEMTIVLANKRMIETFGKGPDVIGLNYTEILPELEHQQIFEQLREVLSTGVPFEAKNSRVDIVIDGILKPHYFNYNFTPIFDENGGIYGVMNTAAEVTELNVSRQETQAAEKRLRLAVASADIGTFETNLISGFTKGSKRFYEIWGIDEKDFNETAVAALLAPADIQIRDDAYDLYERCGKLDYEIKITTAQLPKWVRIKGMLNPVDTGDDVIIGIVQDITAQKTFAEKLTDMVDQRTFQLKRSNDDLKQLGHVLSHDLKEPVRKISMFSKLLKETLDNQSSAKAIQYIDKINLSAERVYAMVDDILNYSSEDGAMENVAKINLTELLNASLVDLEVVIANKSAQVMIDYLPDIEGNKALIHQLFYNLIGNALKFTRMNVKPIIRITGEIENDMALFHVIDNGIGIDERYLDKIFDTFQRLHSKDEYEGTGLGLSLCKKIVERHNGTIQAKALHPHGTEFIIVLPRSQEQYNF